MSARLKELEELYRLEEENAKLRKALSQSSVAIDDWLHTFASELCNKDLVEQAYDRIYENGGILAYIAQIQQINFRLLDH